MPVGVLLLVAVTAALGGWWAWAYQCRALDLLSGHRAAHVPAALDPPAALVAGGTPGGGATEKGPTEISVRSAEAVERVATEQLDRRSGSVLGWAQFSVVSLVVLDGMAIVACRSRDGEVVRRRRRWPSRSRSPWPNLLTTDQTLVLLMGEDAQANRARMLLERWRRAAAILWLRPTAVPGGIEFYDGYGSALRAMLLAD